MKHQSRKKRRLAWESHPSRKWEGAGKGSCQEGRKIRESLKEKEIEEGQELISLQGKQATPPQTVMEVLGIETVEMEPDRVVLKMPVDGRHHQPFGILHGGVSVVLAETAASFGAWVNCDQEKETTVGLEINANHLRPKRDGILTATAEPLHKGRTTMVWEVKIRDEKEKLICVSRCTIAIVPLKRNGKAE